MAKYIPEQHYKGIRKQQANNCPLAFITPYGTDKPAKKRIESVNFWANEDCTDIIDNIPLTGFKISREIRRWSTSNVVWRIEDPREFELEISSGNMAYLLAECNFNKGVIEDELIWCRDGAQNYLLPTNSDEYAKYQLNTQCIKSGLKVKDINIGDHIQLASGESGQYLGVYHVIQKDSYYYHSILHSNRRYILLNNGEYILKASFKDIHLIKHGAEEDNKNWENDIKIPYTYISKKKQNMDNILKTFKIVDVDELAGQNDIFEYQSAYYEYTPDGYYKFSNISFYLPDKYYTSNSIYHNTELHTQLMAAIRTGNVYKKKLSVMIDGNEFEIKL